MFGIEEDLINHRSVFRTMLNHEVQLTLLDDETNVDVMANCRDLSATGMALEIDHPVDVGTLLKVKFAEDEQLSITLCDCKGRVLRCEQESDNLFLLAVELIEC